MKRILPAAAAAFLLAAAPALAAEIKLSEAGRDVVVAPLDMRAGQLDGAKLHDGSGKEIGEIEAVLVNPDGSVAGLGVEVGGFLGIGERSVMLRLDQVQRQGDRIMTMLSTDQLRAQPEWDD